MAIKVALLVITALIAVAAAHPCDDISNTPSLYCNPLARYSTTIGGYTYDLQGCSINYNPCVCGLPSLQCSSTPAQCYEYTWKVGSTESWEAKICQNTWFPGHCYIDVVMKSCNDIVLQQDDITIEPPPEDVEICVEIEGEVICIDVNEGEEAACFCVEDETSGAKLCVPENCDASR